MIVEIVNTGTELMLGRVLNTHQQWLCARLADLGCVVSRQVAVADTAREIERAVRESLSRADVVIATGGLGPTSDDLTRAVLAEALGRELVEDAAVRAHIEEFFARRNRPPPPGTLVQARVPEGALVLPNPNGTAPGLIIEIAPNPMRVGGARGWLVMLPGPPRELQPMFDDSVAPWLLRTLPLRSGFVCRTFRLHGIGESSVQDRIAGPLEAMVAAGLDVGYCARPGRVDVRFRAEGESAGRLVDDAARVLDQHVGAFVFGTGEEELETVLVRRLTAAGCTVAIAESCTGGIIAHRLTNVPGASAVLLAGWVTYSNHAKQALLGVGADTLGRHGAVSDPVAREMAEGARRATRADYAMAVTGIAGPGGGTADKPVGTVFIAVAGPDETHVWKMFNPWDRATFKEVTANQAMDGLRRMLCGLPLEPRDVRQLVTPKPL